MRADRSAGNVFGRRVRLEVALAVGVSLCAGVACLYAIDPAGSRLFPPCPFHALTGFHCPGCGTLRALHQLLHGNLKTAFFLNPLAVLALPMIGYAMISWSLEAAGRKPLPTVFVPAFWIWTLLALILAYWVLKNVPLYPFSLFAPC